MAIAALVALRMKIAYALTRLPFKKRLREQMSLLINSETCAAVADRSEDGRIGIISVKHMIAALTKRAWTSAISVRTSRV